MLAEPCRSAPAQNPAAESPGNEAAHVQLISATSRYSFALAKVLDRWAQEHPDPYLGPHWPST